MPDSSMPMQPVLDPAAPRADGSAAVESLNGGSGSKRNSASWSTLREAYRHSTRSRPADPQEVPVDPAPAPVPVAPESNGTVAPAPPANGALSTGVGNVAPADRAAAANTEARKALRARKAARSEAPKDRAGEIAAPAAPAAEAPPAAPVGPRVFKFRAKGDDGRIMEGYLTAHSAERTAHLLRQRGFIPVEVTEVRQEQAPASVTGATRKRVSRRSLAVFTRQLSILYKSGVPLLKSLGTLAASPEDLALHEVLTAVKRAVSQGASLSRALSRHPECFPPDYVAMVEAAEAAGMMDSVLERLAENLERQVELSSRLRSAMSYPAFVTILTVLMNLFIFTWILPQFEPVFAGAGVELPWLTRMIMSVVRLTNSGWFWVAASAGLGLALYGGNQAVRNPAFREPMDRLMLRMPVYGNIYRRVILVEVFSILYNLFSAGLPAGRSLSLAAKVANNKVYEKAILSVSERLKEGDSLGQAFHRQREHFSKLAIQMLVMGETTGKPAVAYKFLSEYYKTELEYILDGLAATIEPLMVALVGLMTGTVVLAVFLPIYKIVSSLL